MTTLAKRIVATGLFVAALTTTMIVGRYLTFNPAVYFPDQRETYLNHQTGIYIHIIGSIVAMMLGPFQFVAGLRSRFLNLHRWMGRLYLAGCAAGGISGLYMATFAHGGFPSGLGFGFLAVVWMTCSLLALLRILKRRVKEHREWMIRSYALTLAAFALRMWLLLHGILTGMGVTDLSHTQMYIATAWLCWVPNLIAAEIYVNLTRK